MELLLEFENLGDHEKTGSGVRVIELRLGYLFTGEVPYPS